MKRPAVFFDFDDTLHPFLESYMRAIRTLRPLFVEAGRPYDEEPLCQGLHAAWLDPWTRYMAGEDDEESLWWTWFSGGVRMVDGDIDEASLRTLHGHFLAQMRTSIVPYGDVEATLAELRSVYTVGLLSNGAAREQSLRVQGSGLAQLVDVVIIAGEHQLFKPQRGLFDVACRLADAAPADCVLVGDSARDDVAGAQAAGWRGVWLNRDGRSWPADLARPDAEIASLRDLPDVLRTWRTGA
ncbi:MAG: HAD family hydrolase [Firmicutes bacterium]|nr:HAD family hydrolase [Bacillota bacterium]